MRPRYRPPRRGPKPGLFVPRGALLYTVASTACIGLLLFANGLLSGVLIAGALAGHEELEPGGSPFDIPLAPTAAQLAGHSQEPPAPLAAPVAPPVVQPIIQASASILRRAEAPPLPEWARDGILPPQPAIRRLPLLRRLSRSFAQRPMLASEASIEAIQVAANGRPLLRFIGSQSPPAVPYGELIYSAARRWSLNPALVAAVVQVESNFNPRAVSHQGARGLMQLMPATAKRFGVRPERLFDPEPNLYAGTRYLGWLAERYADDLPRILAAYNAGEGAVDRHGGVPPYMETREYVRRAYSALGLPKPTTTATRSRARKAG